MVTLALFAAGEHGPISMVKEASASARTIAHPSAAADRPTSSSPRSPRKRRARRRAHDARQHQVANLDQVIEASLADLGGAATVSQAPERRGRASRRWYADIAKAVAAAAKTVTPAEQETIDKIAALFAIPSA